jgi:hypothetical protein
MLKGTTKSGAWRKKKKKLSGLRGKAIIFALASLLVGASGSLAHNKLLDQPPIIFTYNGTAQAAQATKVYFGSGLLFSLEPDPHGWNMVVKEASDSEDFSRLTPPFHGINPRQIHGWHFRNADNTGPNEPGPKNVNAPGRVREFIFSPAVGRSTTGPGATQPPTPEEVEKIRAYGRGRIEILDYGLDNLIPDKQAKFAWMRFKVELAWQPEADPGYAVKEAIPADEKPQAGKEAHKKKLPLWWEFHIEESKELGYEIPFTEVFLVIGGEPVEKLRIGRYVGTPHELTEEYFPREARAAILACRLFYAGQGDDLFVFPKGRTLFVMWRPVGEGIDRTVRLKTLKTKILREPGELEARE